MNAVLGSILPSLIDVDDSEDDIYVSGEEFLDVLHLCRRQTTTRVSRVCIRNYAENVVLNYRQCDFKAHFRLQRSTFERVLALIESQITVSGAGRPTVSAEKQLLCSLWLLSNPETFR